ncbi:MAG: hypothetical protein AAF492_20540, partial [Verrucomicrobiota bacterium]
SGSIIPLDLSVLNNGPDDANSFDISFPIPTGITNITGTGGGALPSGCSVGGGVISCSISSTLADGDTLLRSFEGQIFAAGGSTITGSASVLNSDPEDPIASNNTDTDTISVSGGTDVAIDISQSPGGTLLVGDASTFTIESSYTGDDPSGLTITTTIPPNYSIDSITSPDGWSCTVAPSTQDVTCTLASGSGAGANVDLGDIFINTTVVGSGSPTVSASISTTTPTETNLANNTDSVAATIADPVVDLRANKSGPNPALAVVGQTYSYRLSATNDGNADFIGTVVLTDSIPANVTVTSYGTSSYTCSPSIPPDAVVPTTITCELVYSAGDPLSPGETTPNAILRFETTAAGTITNSVTVSSPDANIPDTNSGNDTATNVIVSEEGPDSADVFAIKTAQWDPWRASRLFLGGGVTDGWTLLPERKRCLRYSGSGSPPCDHFGCFEPTTRIPTRRTPIPRRRRREPRHDRSCGRRRCAISVDGRYRCLVYDADPGRGASAGGIGSQDEVVGLPEGH